MEKPVGTPPVVTPAVSVSLIDGVALHGPAGGAGPRDLPGSQPKVTFAYLVLHRTSPVTQARLAEAIWGDEPPDQWQPALRLLVSKVRAFVAIAAPAARIERRPAGYVFDLPGLAEVDVEVARTCARLAEQALEADDLDEAVFHAAQANKLAGGSFLPRARSPWARAVAGELVEIQLRTLHVLGEAHLHYGEPERAARTATEAIELAPLHEASHRLAMRALAAAGETAEAAQAYDRCRRLLGDELGVNPSRMTSDLLAKILRG